jgi:DNA-binding transcriptional LysR family regulator
MNWGAFDLNLLVVFDAVMQERSVTRAGGRVGLSQPAVSHALGRLRHMLKDELFVRTPEGMVPTPRAEQLAEPLRRALNDMQLALEPDTFVPEQASRRFELTVNNYAAVILAPRLLSRIVTAAPRIRLDLRPSGARDVLALLDRGELDLAIVGSDEVGERFAAAPLLKDTFVLAMRPDHPALAKPLAPDDLAGLRYLDVSSSSEDAGFLDEWLATSGLSRNIAHRAPRLSAAAILAATDMVAVLSRRLAETWVGLYGLSVCSLPFDSPAIATGMVWHRRFDNQPAHRWLRNLILETAREVEGADRQMRRGGA